MAENAQAPLSIEGFSFTKALGAFNIGDSFLYEQDDQQRVVHVLLSRTPQSLDGFIAEFGRIIGDASTEIVLFAGVTDRGRPYLVTDFLDEQPAATVDTTAPASSESADLHEAGDETRMSSRTQELDQTRLSAVRSTLDDTVLSSRTAPTRATASPAPRTSPSSPKRISIPTLVVSERQALIPNPLAPADNSVYSPRDVHDDGGRQLLQGQSEPTRSVAPRSSRLAHERNRARTALLAVAVSVLASAIGATALLWLLIAG